MSLNKYGGRCTRCGEYIEAGAGAYHKGSLTHFGTCPPPALPERRIDEAFAAFAAEVPGVSVESHSAAFKKAVQGLLREQRMNGVI